MWFYFGIITTVVSLLFSFRQKFQIKSFLQKRDKNLRTFYGSDGSYRLHFVPRQKYTPAHGYLELSCTTSLQFLARYETSEDYWAKAIGLSHECQTGNKSFDDNIYLASITQDDAEVLGENNEVITLIYALLSDLGNKKSLFKKHYLKNELNCDGKTLYLKVVFKYENGMETSEKVIKKLPNLRKLASLLESHTPTSKHFWKVPAQRNTSIILAISTTLGIIGSFEAFRFSISKSNHLFQPFSILPGTLFIAILGLFCLVVATLIFVKKSARKHLILFEVCIFGFLGLLFTTYGFLHDINIEFDKSQAQIINYKIVEKYTERHRSRRSSYTTYHLLLDNTLPPVSSTVEIDNSFYSQLNKGDYVTISIKKGFFNKPWQEYIVKCESCNGDF